MAADKWGASRRHLGAELRRLREEGGKTLEEAAARLECSPAKVSRIETGHVAIRPIDVRAMLDLYGVSSARRAALLTLVRQSRESKGWWREYADIIHQGYEFYISLEDQAAAIWDYQSFLVPGLLQTEAYTRAVMETYGIAPDRTERRIALRKKRQTILTRDRPPNLHVVIEADALRRAVGDDDVMGDQFRHLLDMATRPNISIQLISMEGIHPAEGRAFIMLGFPDPREPKVVYLEQLNDSHLLHSQDQTAEYERVFKVLRSLAKSPDDSAAMIERLLGL
ncbi:helix-turn-helix domain-containing protein [Nonomuraea fuscirosea]|uniref:helix-turn-helix domain-containing protein n=1 Tax=Nonomuraea fuscirosea TaxID=1291556 RepID=UPI0033FF41CD